MAGGHLPRLPQPEPVGESDLLLHQIVAHLEWNSRTEKSVRMPDFGDPEWPQVLCVESANVLENAVVLAPGQLHFHRAAISSNPTD